MERGKQAEVFCDKALIKEVYTKPLQTNVFSQMRS